MNALTVQFPESLRRSITALAEQEGYSVDQFLASAAAEKMAAMKTLDYLRREAAQGRREDFERFLAAVPHREPDETDRLPEWLHLPPHHALNNPCFIASRLQSTSHAGRVAELGC